VEENLDYGKNSTVNVEFIRGLRPRYAWAKPFVFPLTLDRESTDRCFLYACCGNPEIVSKRYEKGSIIVTTNRPVSEWGEVFIDKRLATAIVDRLLHHHRLIEITGESWRHKHRD
jgi:hypothetical protein